MADLGGKLEGTLIAKEQPKQGQWPSQRFTVKATDDRGYDNYITFEAKEKAMAKLAPIQVGQEVSIAYNIRGNKYNDRNTGEEKYFTLLTAWAIDPVATNQPQGAPAFDGPSPADYDNMGIEASDDIPF